MKLQSQICLRDREYIRAIVVLISFMTEWSVANYLGSDRFVGCNSLRSEEPWMGEREGNLRGAAGSEEVKLVRRVRKRHAERAPVFDIEVILVRI